MARSIFISAFSVATSCWRQRLFNESPVLVASGSPAYDHHAIAISDILQIYAISICRRPFAFI